MHFMRQLRKKIILAMRVKRTLLNTKETGASEPVVKKALEEPDSSKIGEGGNQNGDGSSDSQKTLPDTQPVESDDTVTSSLDYYNNQV